jgi:hypothetical protein
MMPREQNLHGDPVAARDPCDQNLVRRRLHRRLCSYASVASGGGQVQKISNKVEE